MQNTVYRYNLQLCRLQYLFASLTAAPKFGCYQPQYTLTVYKQLFDAASYGISHNLEKPRVWARMQNRFTLGKTSFVSLDLTGFTRYSSNVMEYKATAFANLNFYKAFWAGRLTLNVSINDLLCGNGPERQAHQCQQQSTSKFFH